MNKRIGTYFWISFSDFMMALFFSFLVLFIVFFDKFEQDKKNLKTDADKFRKLREIEESTKRLKGNSFDYNEVLKKYYLKREVYFAINSAEIPEENKKDLIEAGQQLKNLMEEIDREYKDKDLKIRYLLILEGLASANDGGSLQFNYSLSYQRAFAIFKLWRDNNIVFDENVIEAIITGSGVGGSNRKFEEEKNRTIYIQIIPLIDTK
jgi:uncharacterized protein YlaN (UPF0358 family)